jgi:hypothetical protein
VAGRVPPATSWATETKAWEALAKRQLEVGAGILVPTDRTLGEVAEEYLTYKRDHGKRSWRDDERIVRTRLLPAFGASLPVRRLTGAAIAQYETPASGFMTSGTPPLRTS